MLAKEKEKTLQLKNELENKTKRFLRREIQ